ncbi:pyrroline-5-carboxylate reductase [Demequina sp. SYSU T00039]|uniref:Pyrroline-5-carboxylate reductase n=1 Tax=Demequina lignilytica TaxID=3051663 RepID=A0AAW7M0M5_9MICO|nr:MULTISPECIES: pyrroline-5-carboxylate reductase [unclassified Demequina]MDN4477964.1 pyrroline-5-carboxylate reductase [Demequina sp. SYSU T00039-1]MDN4487873.1 pyrroline-5-carboxylate reductase [Demequina sp. SYSU T00039]MDN4490744.1 pyrroline-5-carboxylate reductase [Demequina sp. SYSU T00068]
MSTEALSPSDLPRVAVIGGGVMGGTMIAALRVAGWPGESITVVNRTAERSAALAAEYQITAEADPRAALAGAGLVILAVKPQQMGDLLDAVGDAVAPGALVFTVAAALPSSFYESRLPAGTAVVRAMPNTPALVGAGATSISAGAHATEQHLLLAETMLRSTGVVVRVDEELIDAVGATAGSSPAYFYAVVEAVVEAGVMQGLERETATLLAQQTFIGAARLLAESGETPGELRRRVSSPGGTTLAALAAMENAGLQGVISAGMNAAVHRSKELGQQLAG